MTSELETNIVAVERIREYTVTPTEVGCKVFIALFWEQRGVAGA